MLQLITELILPTHDKSLYVFRKCSLEPVVTTTENAHFTTGYQENYIDFQLSEFSLYHHPVSDDAMRVIKLPRHLFAGVPETCLPASLVCYTDTKI
jgi:hypothetical protein